MANMTQWQSQIDGRHYYFSHERKGGRHTLVVNGMPMEVKASFMSSILGFDEHIQLDGRDARLVLEKNQPDIVVDNVHLRSGKPYVKRPAWVIAFAILCILIPIVSLGGALSALIGFGGAAACVAISKSLLPTPARVVLCTVVTIAAWIAFFILAVGVSLIL